MTDPDIKRLLGTAFGEEPPLGIDRDEVLSSGRKRLRTRRLLEAGGVVAAVVVAAVGAVTLTGLVGGESDKLPPAASSTVERPAPPGPTLPLSPTQSPPTTSHGEGPPPSTAVPASPRWAQVLTDRLLNSRLPGMEGMSWSAFPSRDKLEFTVTNGSYVLEADVETESGVGALFVSVSPAPRNATAGCQDLPEIRADCEVRLVSGQAVSVGKWSDKDTGEKRYLAYTIKADGSTVSVVATNLSERQRIDGKLPAQWSPPLSKDTVAQLAVLPGLSYGG